ncbi:hypothetical protein [Cognatilysobacter tabacisoli]|uniref:hypothetical protein n=1 Tax=Cognatilysobacter tabacisoli TaxID=2315424 RepID=UPI000E6B105A|nr:hypothetical protein [Lysobacter tabacisoli]
MNEQDTRFDEAMRDLHRQALGAVSPATRQRLRAARSGAARPRHGGAWALGASVAAVAALAIALQLGRLPERGPATATPPGATAARGAAPSTPVTDAGDVATLDENPDLYLWLASSDADLVALEN